MTDMVNRIELQSQYHPSLRGSIMAISRWLPSLLLVGLLAGCATPPLPVPERGPETGLPARLSVAPADNPTPASVRASPSAHAQRTVLWGGHIVSVANTPPWTRIEVEAHPLTAEGRPDPATVAQGRFLVELAATFDPGIFATGRPLTVAGPVRVDAVAGPVVRAEDYFLWDTVDVPPPVALTRRPPPPLRRPVCYHCGWWPRPFGFYTRDYGFGGGLRWPYGYGGGMRWPYGFGGGYGQGWGWGTSIGF